MAIVAFVVVGAIAAWMLRAPGGWSRLTRELGAQPGRVQASQASEAVAAGAVQVFEFHAPASACQRAQSMNGHRFEVEPGRKLFPVRCGQVDCGCHYRRLAPGTLLNVAAHTHRSGASR